MLAYLEHELVASHYDLKHVYRLILNSKTYQLSSLARGNRPEAEANFAFYPLRRLEAEVLIDAICQVTGTTEKYSSAIPEPYTFLPEGHRSIALPDGSITSPFLEEFGRPPRDTGLESERNNRVNALAAAAHVEFDAHSAETGARPADPGAVGGRAETAAVGREPVPDDPLPLPHGGRIEDCPAVIWRPARRSVARRSSIWPGP